MPTRSTVKKAKRDLRAGKSPTTAAGEFVREEIEHVRHRKHGARSTKQAIAIGLSKARRSGVELKPPAQGEASEKTRKGARRDYARGHGAPARRRSTAKRANASERALKREPRSAASSRALSRQAHQSARRRGPAQRSAAARKAARTRQSRARA